MGQNASATPGQTSPTGGPKSLKPPDDPPPEKRRTREERNGMITEGRVFTRYSIDRTGEPSCSPVLVSYNKATKSIYWTSPDSIRYDPLHSMRIKDISQVVHGKQTAALRSPLAAEAPSTLCFSIVSNKLHQSIDLEASEATTAEEFADAVDYIKGKEAAVAKAQKKNYSLPAPPYQMPITQASLSQILNASLLQTNKKLKGPKKGVRAKSKSQKGRGLSKHNPPLRSPASTTHAPPTRRTQGYTKKKVLGKKRKTTKGSPLGPSLPVVRSGPIVSTPISLSKSEANTPSPPESEFETEATSVRSSSLPSSLDLPATSRVALAHLPR
jgi:hypothetical protein